jgi:hypothetical protein
MEWKPSKEHYKYITNVPFKHKDETNTDYYFEIKEDTLLCIFEPTTDGRDWKSNLNFFPERFDIYPGSDILAHNGIAKQYLGIRNEFLDLCYKPEIKKIYISGFSLGGGLSQFACEDVAYHLPEKEIKSISYEGPRVFCPNKKVKALLKDRQILVKTFWDPVVHVPFKIMGFTEYGKKIWIGKWYKALPIQHYPEEIEKNLLKKFGK